LDNSGSNRPQRYGWLRWLTFQIPITLGSALLHVLLFSLIVWLVQWAADSELRSPLALMLTIEPTVYLSSWFNA
jgi:hypothetical protein